MLSASATATALVGLLAHAVSTRAAPSLSLSVGTPKATVLDVDSLTVEVNIVNSGDETLKLLNDPRGLLNKLETNVFSIVGADGSTPEFTGAVVRYSPEAALAAQVPTEWTTLAPGASLSISHDLAGVYNFTLSGAGAYTFQPVATEFLYEGADGTLQSLEATVDVVPTVDIVGELSSTKLMKRVAATLEKRQSYVSCTSSQQSGVSAGVTGGQSLITSALSDLNASPSGSSRYVRWYGTYTSSRFSTVKTGFTNLNGKLSGWTYNCSCTDSGTYAYVYTTQYGTVYVCTLFFNVQDNGANSKSDTLVHEGSHFTQIRGTQDYTYGISNSLSLATSNPARAVLNADNYAYYSANA